MPVSTTSAAVHITPVVIKTFGKHWKRKVKKIKDAQHADENATDDLVFDEAFHIVKSFIELGTQNTIESLQSFTNTHIPSPFWALVVSVLVPFSSCNRAADVLVEWFGPEDLIKIVGGERWWQVRGLDGVEGEWIAERKYLNNDELDKERKFKDNCDGISRMEKLETVMLYVHGGGYFWGSINTHRYQIIRYARKFRGRAFAVNYRKAPQYPWPCPIHDVLAAYFYLTEPPPDAAHKPVPPSKIVFAGDSAGAGLCVTALTVLRDMGLPLPAGAVLISPWLDLTHSFPSVMANTPSDIIPPYGFVHKHSLTWPVDPVADGPRGRVAPTATNPPPPPGHTDTLLPTEERVQEQQDVRAEARRAGVSLEEAERRTGEPVQSQEEMLRGPQEYAEPAAMDYVRLAPGGEGGGEGEGSREGSSSGTPGGGEKRRPAEVEDEDPDINWEDIERWEPKPPKVLMEDPNSTPLEIRSQIQQYATNEQLMHPLVSPVLQSTLCNLPPLYIIAGNGEVLRDEIIYFAHRAAHPEEFPVRKGVIRHARRQKENMEKFRTPTKVHLQVYDDMPHVLTVFTFTDSAKYAYRSIAQFVKHVTMHSPDHIARNPFPELHRPECEIHADEEEEVDDYAERRKAQSQHRKYRLHRWKPRNSRGEVVRIVGDADGADVRLYKENEQVASQEVEENRAERMPGMEEEGEEVPSEQDHADDNQDIPHVLMIRERVDIRGHVRPMEPKHEMYQLKMRPNEVGVIKEAPVRRWLNGQELMDKKFPRTAAHVVRKRRKLVARAERMVREAREQGLLLEHDDKHDKEVTQNGDAGGESSRPAPKVRFASQNSAFSAKSRIDPDRRWGPLDLAGERAPPSAIAQRCDTYEALALLKKNIYHTAPATHKTVPQATRKQQVRAAFDPNDTPIQAPRQSVSEQQVPAAVVPLHGLSIWNSLVLLFMRKSSQGKRHAANAIEHAVGSTPASGSSSGDAAKV
ncbi:alpha/beta-hydrolase [Dentipellis sp. KUC8613]|nr:alpha/beta-hydrolase [Dentipellis sp. KUC8613]